MSKPLRIGKLLSIESVSSVRVSSALNVLSQLILVDLSVVLVHELLVEHQLPQLADLHPCGPRLQVHADQDEWHLHEVLGDLELIKERAA